MLAHKNVSSAAYINYEHLI